MIHCLLLILIMAAKRTVVKRDGQVKLIIEMMDKSRQIVEDPTRSRNPEKELMVLMKNIRHKKTSVDELNEIILNAIDEEEMDGQMRTANDLDLRVDTELEILQEYLENLSIETNKSDLERTSCVDNLNPVNNRDQKNGLTPSRQTRSESIYSRSSRHSNNSLATGYEFEYDERREPEVSRITPEPKASKRNLLRLPKFQLEKFTGDPTAWPGFFDTFRIAVHENPDLTDIERFTYLKGYITGDAARCIEGLNLTDANYDAALRLLKDRFGNQKLIISRHMSALLDLEKVKSSSKIKELRAMYDKVMVNIRALRAFGITSDHFGPMLSPIILKVLPADIKLHITRNLRDQNWMIDELLESLKAEIETQESCGNSSSMEDNRKVNSNFYDCDLLKIHKHNTNTPLHSTDALYAQDNAVKCVFCQGTHYSDKCPVVTDIGARLGIVKKLRLCFKCLGSNHHIKRCTRNKNCFVCKSRFHHSALCQNRNQNSKDSTPVLSREGIKTNTEKFNKENKSAVDVLENNPSLMTVNKNHVFLQTIRATVTNTDQTRKMKANIIFDSGSTKTYVSQRLADMLELKVSGKTEMKINSFGNSDGRLISAKEVCFCFETKQNGSICIKGFAVPTICAPLDDYRVYVDEMKQRQDWNIDLDNFLPEDEIIDGEIHILLGSDFYWQIVERSEIRLNDELVLVNSKLGYMLNGPLDPDESKEMLNYSTNCVHVMKVCATLLGDEEDRTESELSKILSDKVEKFWNMDSFGVSPCEKSVYDLNLEKIKLMADGRYQVELPMREGHPLIHDNYSACIKRLSVLKRSLERESLLDDYDRVIQDQISRGIVEIVDDSKEKPEIGSFTYIPHRAVVKENKSTTKVRIVYDCSAKAGEQSLNECLYKGPCLTPLIFDNLLKFRLHDVALVADIESAYLQIWVVPEQRDLLRFLWFTDIRNGNFSIEKYRFTRVLFGAAPSQYLLNSVLKKHSERYHDIDPKFENMVKSSFYVDDLNLSVKNSEEAKEFYEKCKTRYAEGGFNIRKWRSNNSALKDLFAEKEEVFENLKDGKVLGISWDDVQDFLIFRLDKLIPENYLFETVTKRQILKILAAFYDPMGWIQVLVVKLKMIFQEAWKVNLGWDEDIPFELKEKWKKLIEYIRYMKDIRLPRCYCYNDLSNPVIRVVLQGFSDASMVAYGACVYLKFVKQDGDVRVTLVSSKSRISPIKRLQTIPRLELMGNVLLARLIKSVVNGFQDNLKFDAIYCHSDSKISLSWIKAVKKDFQPFVQNRVNEIRPKTPPEMWHFCKTDQNPADLLTRYDNEGIASRLWWEGPEFLKNGDFHSAEPVTPAEGEMVDFKKELKHKEESNLLTKSCPSEFSIDNVIDINDYSNVTKLFRVTAYVLRFINNLKQKVNKSTVKCQEYIDAEEIRNASNLWIKANQIHLMEKDTYKETLLQLNCVTDSDGLLRCQGRMKNASAIPEHTRCPILLCKEHRLSTLIVFDCHGKVMHRGVKQTLNELRSRYWVTGGRNFVKKIIGPCVKCKKLNSRAYPYPGHSDLPELRFDTRYPFASVGCDYLGPLYTLPVFGDSKKRRMQYFILAQRHGPLF